jgi:hypothetical protein
MRFELHHPGADSTERPLVGGVEPTDGARPGHGEERDEAIIRLLREKLRGRPAPQQQAPKPRPAASVDGESEDRYEPQRLSRKICWQYDQSARKIPLLRRHYI